MTEQGSAAQDRGCTPSRACPNAGVSPGASHAAKVKLSVAQRSALEELAEIRDNGNTGEAYFYPSGSQYRTAHILYRMGLLRFVGFTGTSVYQLTDEGYAAVRSV